MASFRILAWHGIPSVVEARDGAGAQKTMLSDRFQALIDQVAMRRGLAGTDAYLEGWQRSRPEQRQGSATDVAAAVAGELEAQFEQFSATAHSGTGGKAP